MPGSGSSLISMRSAIQRSIASLTIARSRSAMSVSVSMSLSSRAFSASRSTSRTSAIFSATPRRSSSESSLARSSPTKLSIAAALTDAFLFFFDPSLSLFSLTPASMLRASIPIWRSSAGVCRIHSRTLSARTRLRAKTEYVTSARSNSPA